VSDKPSPADFDAALARLKAQIKDAGGQGVQMPLPVSKP